MNSLEERIRTGLAAEAQAWPDPPPPGAIQAASRTSRWGVSLLAAAAVLVVVGGVAFANRATTTEAETLTPAGKTSTAAPVETVVEHLVTLSDGTEVVISMPVAEGSDFDVVWQARLTGGSSNDPYANALVHIWLDRSADAVMAEIEEVNRLSGSEIMPNRHIVDHDGHAYDFQLRDYSDPTLLQESLDRWLSVTVVNERPDSVLPIVTVGGGYEVDYGPAYGISGTYVNGESVTIGITEGCEVDADAPVEYANDTRASIEWCALDGTVEVLVAGSPEYIERIRELDVVRLAGNP